MGSAAGYAPAYLQTCGPLAVLGPSDTNEFSTVADDTVYLGEKGQIAAFQVPR